MSEPIANIRQRYARKGYALVKQAVPAEVAGLFLSITQQAMGNVREQQARFAVGMEPLNMPAYDVYSSDYPSALTFLWGLTPYAETLTGKRLLPTYCYFRAYQKGGVCLVHSDRPACEHSMTLTLGSSHGKVWPFSVGVKRLEGDALANSKVAPDFGTDEYSTVEMQPGDAVLYQGVHHRHGRLDPNPNAWSAHIFLHWVDRDGPYKEFAFDKRRLPEPAQFHF